MHLINIYLLRSCILTNPTNQSWWSSKPSANDENAWADRFRSPAAGIRKRCRPLVSKNSDDFRVCVRGDIKKWSGKSCVVVSFLAPILIVLKEPQHTVLALGLQHTPHALLDFHKQFVIDLRVFETTVASEGTCITKFMPSIQAPSTITSG